MSAEDPFAITARPERSFPSAGGMEYQGGTSFLLEPTPSTREGPLADAVVALLESGPYQFGDFHDLPMPLWLVRDRETTDTFRVVVRDGTVRLHVLPRTESDGLRRFYRRLEDHTDADWSVTRRTNSE